MRKPVFVLASKSPRRKELLNSIGINPQIVTANIDEGAYRALLPSDMVRTLAMLKATDVARSFNGNIYVIGADTCVCIDEKILGKPKTIDEAREMLGLLSGREHLVYTGYCICDTKGNACAKSAVTKVKFRKLSEKETEAYIKTREPMDKAGGYGIQGRGAIFVEKIDGDYSNVVGLPLCALSEMFKEEFGIELL